MFTVYRVQNANNIGPYQSGARGDWYWEMLEKHRHYTYPNASEDNLWELGCTNNHIFGFSSLDKLHSWFDEYLVHLVFNNFIIAKYEVEEYIEGESGKQVVFIPTTFTDITSELIEDIYAQYTR